MLILMSITCSQLPTFSDCGCIMDSFTTNISGNFNESGMGPSPTAITGICGATQCQLLGPFMVLIGIGVLILYSRVVPLVFVTLR